MTIINFFLVSTPKIYQNSILQNIAKLQHHMHEINCAVV